MRSQLANVRWASRAFALGLPLWLAAAGCLGQGPTGALEARVGVDGGIAFPDTGPSPDRGAPPDGGSFDVGGPFDGSFDGSFDGGPPERAELGHWAFDDCNRRSRVLVDTSGNGNDGTRTAGVECAPGVDGSGIKLDANGDNVTIAHQAAFQFTNHVTAMAWVNPTAVGRQEQIIVEKAGAQHQTFSLRLINKRAEFSIEQRNGRVVKTSAPLLKADRWSHVAGQYDGQFIFLFIDGQQVGQVFANGQLRNVAQPIRIGGPASGSAGQFRGLIDDVRLFNEPVSEAEIIARACVRHPSTLAVTTLSSGPVQPETPVSYDVTVTNRDFGAACTPADYFFVLDGLPSGFSAEGDFNFMSGIASGASAVFPVTITSSTDAEPGTHQFPFSVENFSSGGGPLRGELTYDLAEPTGCNVKTSRELMVRSLSVVEDPIRSVPAGNPANPRTGAWTFGKLMRDMAPTPAEAPAMVEALFKTWLTDQHVNGFTIPSRQAMQSVVLDAWPRTAAGELDLSQSPLRLLAIVNRVDLRNLSNGNAGEGRFVFGVVSGFELQFTVILEYRLPASSEAEVQAWADRWHELGSLPFPSEQYNAALQAITTRFAGRNAEPGRPNGSALSQLRTNEIALADPWELREFNLSPVTGFLAPVTVKLTPDNSFDQTQTLADFVNQNEAAILVERHDVPETFAGASFLGGSSFNFLNPWTAPGINNNEARHKFSLNTCNGCHGQETGTGFLHVFPRSPGSESQLSGFLSGITVFDPVSGEPRALNDLGRRRTDLFALVCTDPSAPAPQRAGLGAGADALAAPAVSLSRGMSRTH